MSARTHETLLPVPVTKLLQSANIPDDSLGVLVLRLSDGAMILSRQPQRAMQPASTMKIVTSVVGLEKLGPTFRGRVEMRSSAMVVDGVLQGDLVVQGFADVDFTWRDFQIMLQTVREKGIREIQGDVIIDRNHFRPARMDIGVPPFDDSPEFPYNVIPDALNLNGNALQFEFASDANAVRVKSTPVLDGVNFVSRMTLVDVACEKWEDGWKIPVTKKLDSGAIEVEFSGAYPKNCVAKAELNVIDRADVAERLFRTQWRALGGTLRGKVREDAAPSGTRALAQHRSRPLAEVVRDINKQSDNLMARLTYLSLGAAKSSDNTLTAADAEVRAWMAQKNIATDGLVIDNGSGLSRSERIRPAQLAALLRAAYASKWAPEFLASLPIVAVDGTMRNRLRDSRAKEIARIKTGTLRDVSAIAGYVPNASGEMCVIVAMLNHPRASDRAARAVLDALLDWVVREGEPVRDDGPLGQYSGQ